jgi:hypothetical protein
MRVEGAARKANIHGTVVALTLHELSAAAHHADRDEDIAVERTDLGRHTCVRFTVFPITGDTVEEAG